MHEWFLVALILLVFSSAFFSAAETGMMAINRYRLRHLARKKNRTAKRVLTLLERPDRLLGVILIGNTFANILASALATVLAVKWYGDYGVFIATITLTLIILIFGEIAPKTFAASAPQKVAFFASFPLRILLNIFYPVVWLANLIVNGLLKIIRVNVRRGAIDYLSHEELRTIVHEATGKSALHYQDMMLGVLDLAHVRVDDIMIPRNDIVGIDLDRDINEIIVRLHTAQHTRLPVYRENINNVVGILHMRRAMRLFAKEKFDKNNLEKILDPVHFVLEGTSLNRQLVNFRHERCRIGVVVDEYGEVKGMVTLEDILEEIVGEFTTDLGTPLRNVTKQKDGSYLVDGMVYMRDLNRALGWDLPIDGPKTLSGLIVEHLEMIPEANVGMRLGGYPIEVMEVKDKMIKSARVWPQLRRVIVAS